MTFLEEWDDAIAAARLHGKPGRVWVFDEDPEGGAYPIARLVGRTMHPAFMQPKEIKYDPRRQG